MFDIGFTEVTLIAVIGLIVIGPERLPRVAREIGVWVGRLRRYVAQVKADIDREIRADELKELVNKPAREIKDAIKETEKDLGKEIGAGGGPVSGPGTGSAAAAGAGTEPARRGPSPAAPDAVSSAPAPAADENEGPQRHPGTREAPARETG